MKVLISRSPNTEKVAIDISYIYEQTVRWTNCIRLGGKTYLRSYCFLTAQIDYDYAHKIGIASGTHSCYGNPANIYIYKTDNLGKEFKEGYQYLCSLAGKKPKKITGVPKGSPPCTKKILQKLGDERCVYKNIRDCLIQVGYNPATVRRAFKRLENAGRISFSCNKHLVSGCEVWAKKK